MKSERDESEELTRVTDRIEADLLAAFLEDDEVTFKMIKNAQTMASLMPPSQVPVVFHVLKEHIPRAKDLLEAFQEEKKKQIDDAEDEASEDR